VYRGQTAIHTEEPFVLQGLGRHWKVEKIQVKSPGSDQIPAKLIQAGLGGGVNFAF
jgi:hypothetical protein